MKKADKLRVFVDSDVVIAGCAAPTDHSASLVVLGLAEITLIEALTSVQVIDEVTRNLAERFPKAVPAFDLIVQRSLTVVPGPSAAELDRCKGMANKIDLPILAAAHRERCQYLVSFNLRHYEPGHPEVTVLRPGALVLRIRDQLTRL